MKLWGNRREVGLYNSIEALSEQLAQVSGTLTEKADILGVVADYETVKKQLVDAQLEMSRIHEAHAKEKREIEHKIGLHKIQVEQEIKASRKDAELAVREEALAAEKDRFEQEMDFMSNRMKDEIESQRNLMQQILERLPKFERSYSTVEHVGETPPPAAVRLEIGKGDV